MNLVELQDQGWLASLSNHTGQGQVSLASSAASFASSERAVPMSAVEDQT